MTSGKTLCLNMIVKNEMANLERCLLSVVDHIACWVIGDTGSTDGSQDFIRSFFAARNVPGELHSIPFHNFEQARNAALDCAYASALAYDYLLFDDADMELVVEDRDFRNRLSAPSYAVLQRNTIVYWNTRLVQRSAGARYRGVTHEYVDVSGVEQLHGVWYKDYASGSNRVDKFQRDIRLLTEALEQEPDNQRYWFYLAQSYRDSGQTAKAAEAYAKRADMGGWGEEAWYARLQEARCLRQLGDEGGFVRQALAAFNQRPRRAEPLYDLARFYRERGMHDASALFSEPGLKIPRPEEDILFLEDFVYSAGFKEEYSISANYSGDAARKERGFAACNWLALNRTIPAQCRDLARWNIFFYLKPASAMMPSLLARPIKFTPPEGYNSSTPSVARLGNELVVSQSVVNFVLTEDDRYCTPNEAPIHTRNFLLRLDADLALQSASEILPPDDIPVPAFHEAQGFTDARLFTWRDQLWCISKLRQLTPEGWSDQVLTRIEDAPSGQKRHVDWRVLRPAGPRRHERNWTPKVAGERLSFLHIYDPVRWLDENGRVAIETASPIASAGFGGGSQAIAFDGGWLTLIHEVTYRDKLRFYQHRFVWFDAENRLKRISHPFFFIENGVELAAGLAWHPDEVRLVITYTVGDRAAWIATVEVQDVLRLLEDAERLSWGVPSRAADDTKGPCSVFEAKESGRCQGSNRSAQRASSLSSSSKAPFARPKSSWTPATPLAGTELMVAALKERLGQELDLINLGINHPGFDNADPRPRIVWIHHDVDQKWVQWCRDTELVATVTYFVFVSYWQRQRYIDTFKLRPERCVVLRHALDIEPQPRIWQADPILRCAYTSTPFRGLSILLDAWERVKPLNAELHIWSSMKLYVQDDAPYDHLYRRAQSLHGVTYHGLWPNLELRAALRDIHLLVYPCTFAETACLAAIEAMAAGCRLIVPALGALPETTAGYANIYPSTPNPEKHVAAFSEAFAAELSAPWAGAPEQSSAQQRHCATTYNWPARLHEWRQLIDSACRGGAAAKSPTKEANPSSVNVEPLAS